MRESTFARLRLSTRGEIPGWRETIDSARRLLGYDPDAPGPPFVPPTGNVLAGIMGLRAVAMDRLRIPWGHRLWETWVDAFFGERALATLDRRSLYPPPSVVGDGSPDRWPERRDVVEEAALWYSAERPTPKTIPDPWISQERARDRRLYDRTAGQSGALLNNTDPDPAQRFCISGPVGRFTKEAIRPLLDDVAAQRKWLERCCGPHPITQAADRAKVPGEWGTGRPKSAARAAAFRRLAAAYGDPGPAYRRLLYNEWFGGRDYEAWKREYDGLLPTFQIQARQRRRRAVLTRVAKSLEREGITPPDLDGSDWTCPPAAAETRVNER